jgi:hypothetical protein
MERFRFRELDLDHLPRIDAGISILTSILDHGLFVTGGTAVRDSRGLCHEQPVLWRQRTVYRTIIVIYRHVYNCHISPALKKSAK